jgi:hypothetical protein
VKKQVAILVAASLAVWAGVAYLAQKQWGQPAVIYSAVAVGLCLMPTVLTMVWAGWALRQSPEQQLFMVLGGAGLRMGVVLGAGLVLHSLVPYFEQPSFWVWLLGFYLLTLTLEMVLVVRSRPASDV